MSVFGYFRQAAALLLHPQLRLFVIMPMIVNVLLLGSLLLWGWSQLERLDQWLLAWLPAWLDWLSWLLWPLSLVLMLLGVGMLFSVIGNWLAAPFNGLLAERCEQLLRQGEGPTASQWQWADVPRSLRACTEEIDQILAQLPGINGRPAQRLAAEMDARLRYTGINEILDEGLHAWLNEFIPLVRQLGNAIHSSYLEAA